MDLATKVYHVLLPGQECRKCVHYKRPRCVLTDTFTWAKNYCDDYERKNGEEAPQRASETGSR
jgi:hypothetical protein